MKLVLVAAAAALAGCSGVHMHSGPFGAPAPMPGVVGGVPGTTNPEGAGGPFNSPLPEGSSRETVCRSSAIPRGWVAVDYVDGGSKCGSSDQPYSAAVLQRLAPLPTGTVLLICSGQTVPINWRRESSQEGPTSSGQCPRNPKDTHTGPTTVLIVRER